MTWRYGSEANAAFLQLAEGVIHESQEVFPDVVLDFDEAGHILGLEVLDARRLLPPAALGLQVAAE